MSVGNGTNGVKNGSTAKGLSTGHATWVVIGVFLISLSAYPIMYLLNESSHMQDHKLVFVAGVTICFLTVALFYLLLRTVPASSVNYNYFFYVFAVFTFTAVVDLFLALTLDGFIDIGKFYLLEGEVYLQSANGLWINYWDGTGHLVMYLLLIYYMLKHGEHSCRFLGFYWVGSIMNSLLVFLPGNVIGLFGSQLRASYLLNVPYALFPLLYTRRLFKNRSEYISTSLKANKSNNNNTSTSEYPSITERPLDILLILFLIFASVVSIWRALVVFDAPIPYVDYYSDLIEPYFQSRTKYPLLQVLVYAFYGVPIYVAGIFALVSPPDSPWFPDLVSLNGGAAIQGQLIFIASSIHAGVYQEEGWKGLPGYGHWIFWAVNLALLIGPQLLVARVCTGNRQAAFYAPEPKVHNKKLQ